MDLHPGCTVCDENDDDGGGGGDDCCGTCCSSYRCRSPTEALRGRYIRRSRRSHYRHASSVEDVGGGVSLAAKLETVLRCYLDGSLAILRTRRRGRGGLDGRRRRRNCPDSSATTTTPGTPRTGPATFCTTCFGWNAAIFWRLMCALLLRTAMATITTANNNKDNDGQW